MTIDDLLKSLCFTFLIRHLAIKFCALFEHKFIFKALKNLVKDINFIINKAIKDILEDNEKFQ